MLLSQILVPVVQKSFASPMEEIRAVRVFRISLLGKRYRLIRQIGSEQYLDFKIDVLERLRSILQHFVDIVNGLLVVS
jgi:hypothetical protein